MAVNPNFNDPLFLHPSDTPCTNLVNDQLTGTENYGVWSRAMLIALRAKNKTGFIDGTFKRPNAGAPTIQQCERCNALLLSWIINTVSKDIFRGIVYAIEASVVWSDLKEQFDKQRLLQFLMGLNESYIQIRSHILMMIPLPTVGQEFSIISQEESHRAMISMEAPASAVFLSNQNRRDYQQKEVLKCDYFNWNGHTRATCYRLNGYPPGHKMFKPQGRGVPQKTFVKNKRPQVDANVVERRSSGVTAEATHDTPIFSQAQYAEILKLLEKCKVEAPSVPVVNMAGTRQKESSLISHFTKVPWIIDSGANEHMVGDSLTLRNPKSIANSSGTVGLPNGSKILISKTGSIALTDSIMLDKVLQIPDFRFNLLSVSRLTKELQCYVTFYPTFCLFQDLKTGQIMGIGKERNGLYHLENTSSPHSGFYSFSHFPTSRFEPQCHTLTLDSTLVCSSVNNSLWHQRLGHISVDRMKLLPFISTCDSMPHCSICPQSKQTRLRFPRASTSKTLCPLELLHMDIWGPFKTVTYNGERDVVFHENMFPFSETKQQTQIFPSHPIVELDSISSHQPRIPETPEPEPLPPRRSSRHTTPPIWTRDYTCPTLPRSHLAKSKYPISDSLTYSRFNPTYQSFLTSISSEKEPQYYHEAITDPRWRNAMDLELSALESNCTWDIVDLPVNKKPIGCKWVYKIKHNPDGTMDRFKARLVANGYTQQQGIDYHDTFSPTAKIVTIRCMLSLAAIKGWNLHQMDVTNAFLQGDLDEEVYMDMPLGYSRQGESKVCLLRKSLYGLKQASRQWNHKFSSILKDASYVQSQHDHSLFIKQTAGYIVLLLVYVDDIVITGDNELAIQELKAFLHSRIHLKDLGPLRYFLGIEIARSRAGISLCQRKYTLELISEMGLSGAKPCATPMEQNLRLTSHELDLVVHPEILLDVVDFQLSDANAYKRLVGKLIYLTVTRPDLFYVVQNLSQFLHSPKKSHMDAAIRVVRYLKSAPGLGILLSANSDIHLSAYCDSDWAACPMSRRSLTGYCVKLGDSLVSCKTKKQSTVSRSSAEAEYMAMAITSCEIVWITGLLRDMGVSIAEPATLFCDNMAAMHIAANPLYHERTKHIEIDCHLIREKIQAKLLKTSYVPTNHQLADIFTKSLSKEHHTYLLSKIGVLNLHQS
ncbi:uncharacterized protein LOC142537497 [Primulina tabacum]|uniref:uncharacterized protein LOC142537497 n=1 Tax=Primulina tabacum TaxID=48773 RepID=UPI003F5A381E